MLGGNCGISKDVPPFCTTRPVALNRVAGLNVIGMRRSGMDGKQRQEVKSAFNTIYREDLPIREAADKILATNPAAPAAEFAEFVKSSKRGIAALRSSVDDDESGE